MPVVDVLKGTLTTFNALKGTLKTSATPDRRCAPYPRNEAKPATDDNPANVRGHGTSDSLHTACAQVTQGMPIASVLTVRNRLFPDSEELPYA